MVNKDWKDYTRAATLLRDWFNADEAIEYENVLVFTFVGRRENGDDSSTEQLKVTIRLDMTADQVFEKLAAARAQKERYAAGDETSDVRLVAGDQRQVA